MSVAQVRVEANQIFPIDGVPYRVAEHPALPGIPYVQRGARGFVVQIVNPDGERMALKYFKIKYRVPALLTVTEALRRFADLPGMRAAQRTVFTRIGHPDLVRVYPALEYGVLMPWLPGVTWYDVITARAVIGRSLAQRWATGAAHVLAGLEGRGLAHCDIAGANVMVDKRDAGVQLVDIEELYSPDLARPVEAPAGQDGYQHRTSRAQGQWRAEGDRFGAAVLIAEMLGWASARVRQNSADEHFFAASELQDPASVRYRLLSETLRAEFGERPAALFEQAWRSAQLSECPPLSAWREALEALPPPEQAESATPLVPGAPESPAAARSVSPTDGVVSGRRAIQVQIPLAQYRAEPPIEMPQPESTKPESAKPESPPPPASAPSPETLDLAGKKLCRHCGAANDARESFCMRCGFYIGTGARRAQFMAGKAGSGTSPATRSPVPPPQAVPLNRDANQIIAARRVGKGGQMRIDTPREAPVAEGNIGQWIVLAIILGAILTLVLIALMG